MNPVVKVYALWLLLLTMLIVSILPLSIQNHVIRDTAAVFQQMKNMGRAVAAPFAELPKPGMVVYPSVSVLEARHMLEQNVSVEGIVMSKPGSAGTGRPWVQLQDPTGGILVSGELPETLQPGDRLRVDGVVGDNQGVLEVRATDSGIQVVESGQDVPRAAPLKVEDLPKEGLPASLKGTAVTISGVVVPASEEGSDQGRYRLAAPDRAGHSVRVRLAAGDSEAFSGIQEGMRYEITGILSLTGKYEHEIVPYRFVKQ
ncbi:single stranded DNA-binding domain-containing protein [Paenibacillus puerhi]|uniref:hypothetical protein n=1 Tax=Paenibacillus puerhi TaxID=2692622 RepID=UPI00135BA9FA|nr:hypothetical protein [Paenibacillus puerhi]